MVMPWEWSVSDEIPYLQIYAVENITQTTFPIQGGDLAHFSDMPQCYYSSFSTSGVCLYPAALHPIVGWLHNLNIIPQAFPYHQIPHVFHCDLISLGCSILCNFVLGGIIVVYSGQTHYLTCSHVQVMRNLAFALGCRPIFYLGRERHAVIMIRRCIFSHFSDFVTYDWESPSTVLRKAATF